MEYKLKGFGPLFKVCRRSFREVQGEVFVNYFDIIFSALLKQFHELMPMCNLALISSVPGVIIE